MPQIRTVGNVFAKMLSKRKESHDGSEGVVSEVAGRPAGALAASIKPVVEMLETRQYLSVPNGPFAASASATSSGINVNWYDNSSDETGFIVQRSANGGAFTQIASLAANSTSFTDTGATGGSQDVYRIFAFNAGGNSGSTDTNAVTAIGSSSSTPTPGATTGTATSVPNGPFALSTKAASATSVTLNWYSNSNNESGFAIERKTWSGNYAQVATVGAGVTAWTDTSAAGSTQYTYRVRAYNNKGYSGYTNESAVTTPAGGSSGSTGTSTGTTGGVGSSSGGSAGSGISFTPSGGWGGIPNGPFALSGTGSGNTWVSLSWASNSNNEGGFVIDRKTDGGTYVHVGTVGPGIKTFTDWQAQTGTHYTYRVAAYNSAGLSNYTNEYGAWTTGGTTTSTQPSTGPGITPPAGFFPIAAFSQGEASFDTWIARGVNTMVHDHHTDYQALEIWTAAAAAKGLWMVRNPRANPADDLGQKYLLGWVLPDEPDIWGIAPSTLAAEYAQLKAVNPNMPVMVNFSGANAIYPLDSLPDSLYTQMSQSADIISNDVYPLSTYSAPQYIDLNTPLAAGDPGLVRGRFNAGNAVDVLRQLSGGKTQWAFIETSKQNISSPLAAGARPPTADEFRGEVWDAIIHGAKGITYFPQSFNPDVSDATPADVAAEMTKVDAEITQLSGAITSSSNTSSNPISGLPQGIEGTWRYYNGHYYYFVLNMSHTPAYNVKVNLPGMGSGNVTVVNEGRTAYAANGAVTDSFGAYQLHVYMF